MPHLSPFNWVFSPIIFWLVLTSLSSILWWSQYPCFPSSKSPFSYPSNLIWSW